MTYNLTIGKQVESSFVNAGERIAQTAKFGKIDAIRENLNELFFKNGTSSAKSLGQLFSISHSSSNARIEKIPHVKQMKVEESGELSTSDWFEDGNYHNIVAIEKKASFSAVLGILEGIPVIGTVIAFFNGIRHLIGMNGSAKRLNEAATALLEMKKKNADHEAILEKTKTVFKEAMDYTIHRNYVTGSALSLVPFLKPIVRLFELYAYKPETPVRPAQITPIEISKKSPVDAPDLTQKNIRKNKKKREERFKALQEIQESRKATQKKKVDFLSFIKLELAGIQKLGKAS